MAGKAAKEGGARGLTGSNKGSTSRPPIGSERSQVPKSNVLTDEQLDAIVKDTLTGQVNLNLSQDESCSSSKSDGVDAGAEQSNTDEASAWQPGEVVW